MKTKLLHLFLAIAVLGLAGCGGGSVIDSGGVTEGLVKSAKARAASPDVSAGDLAELVAGNNAFAFDLYQAIRGSDGNLFYSPYSISLALAMTYAGARGETESQMADTLRFTLPQARLHPAFNALDTTLASRGEGARGKDGEGFKLAIANSIWGQAGYTFLDTFLDTLAENYGAGLRLLDFAKAPEGARKTINDWVSEQTEERIRDLLPPDSITDLTRLVLTNAIYFNAAWRMPFDESMTRDGVFHLLDGGKVTVPMMSQMEFFGYAQGDGYQAVELLYNGGELSMVILLPDAGRFADFEAPLDADTLAAIVGNLAQANVLLTMPKFRYDARLDLAGTLSKMGMPEAFGMSADFSGMDGKKDLFISGVFHKAFVSVDEAGTEAAAATAVVMTLKAAPGLPVEVTVDRPFIFLIRDIETGAILFVGRVLNPAA